MQVEMQFETAARYKSASQRARVITELWAERNLYCANCDSATLVRSEPNCQAIDFTCPECRDPFQLKSQSSMFAKRLVDAGYEAMCRAIIEGRTPNLVALHYDPKSWRISNALLVPRFAFSMSAIEKRRPLALTARRAGWIGCNILLCNIPDDAKIDLIRGGIPVSPGLVRRAYSRLRPLDKVRTEVRGWTLDVLKIARSLGKACFSLDELYALDEQLKRLHPANRHVRPKIRQQLQRLRDLGIIEFLSEGRYRFRDIEA